MVEILNSNLAKELLIVLSYIDDDFIDKLPNDLFEMLKNLAADSTKDFFIQKDKELNEQNLSEECKNWLSFLYYEYATSSEKNDLINIWMENNINFKKNWI